MDSFIRDFRHGLRLLIKNRTLTLVGVAALAVGIGANTAIFSAVDAMLLRPFDFRELDRLVSISETTSSGDFQASTVAPADYLDWQKETSSFERLAAHQWWNVNLTGIGEPERIQAQRVSSNFFPALGVEAAIGRTFGDDEQEPGRHQVAVLSHGLWQRKFGGDDSIVGRSVSLNGVSFIVIGVMPRDFDYPASTEIWSPIPLTPDFVNDRAQQYLFTIGRLKPNASVREAGAELNTIASRLEQEHPSTNRGRRARLKLLRDAANGDFTPVFMWTLMGAVGFVLMLAAVNVANMQLAQATARQKEMAIRSALGASRLKIVRQLLTESVLLSVVGGVAGILVAVWLLDLIKFGLPPEIVQYVAGWRHMSIDTRALTFTLVVSVITGVASGFAPALQASRPDLNEALKEGSRSTSMSPSRARLRNLLVIAEVALALVLLVGSGLMIKGFARLVEANEKGFDPENVLNIHVSLIETRYQDPDRIAGFYREVLEKLEA
ncbi:MAG TPA: ABC transporter permease, partial [Pyrinomonadaceae bacterium]|nr:ABC transporter permease [Pyrinomonadaceae bacterium]